MQGGGFFAFDHGLPLNADKLIYGGHYILHSGKVTVKKYRK
jgi:hypothetical protein